MVDAAVDSELFPENRTCHMSRFIVIVGSVMSVISYRYRRLACELSKKGVRFVFEKGILFYPQQPIPLI
jgi:hypothetical protein